MSAHVFLTGATGFLGGRLAHALAARGTRVHALCRAESDTSGLAGLGLYRHDGDLTDEGSVRAALAATRELAGAEPLDVLHCGALISYRSRDAGSLRATNVVGTRNVLHAALKQRVRRFLHVSSVVTVGLARAGEALDEGAAYNAGGLGVAYVDTKRRAEEQVLAAASRLDCVVANPGAIFGKATERSNSAHFLRQVADGQVKLAPPGSVAVLGVEDAAEGCLLALEQGRRGERYLLTESNLSHRELLTLAAQLTGAPPPRLRVAAPLWALATGAACLVDRVRPLERLTPQSLRMLGSHLRFDSTRARREELGWRPRPFRQVLADSLEALGLRAGP